ncbi:hypothetical protein F511_17622 [Dorcoceras hygrometricum]|uniref:Uncharacterized protein n=1 Tax=Dorcoceras hygrometricum TaxID=472368 RepID=A0A2Z7CI16_9LAMI|nr:hypothetical protein F511_17622 [Dorcoceras hygrometricum]
MMNSRRICPVDGSQYKDSAVGLVFMESAAGLAMETSKVESAVRNQRRKSSRKLLFTSRCYLEIATAKRCRLHKLIRQRFALALKIQQMLFALINQSQDPDASNSTSSRELQCTSCCYTSSRKLCAFSSKAEVPDANRKIQTQATAHPVVSYNVPAVAIHPVASLVHLVAKLKYQTQSIQSTKISAEDEFSRSDKSAAKQLTIYEELSKLDVNC